MSIFSFFKAKKPQPQRVVEDVLSSASSPYYAKSQIAPYNPDDLVTKKGSLEVYEKMLYDDQVKAVLTMKKHAVLSSGWEVSGDDEKKVEFLKNNFERIDIESRLFEILSALEYGFSVSELVYEKSGNEILLKTIKTRAPHSFRFITDSFGNLKQLVQFTNEGEINLPPDKFVIYSYNPQFGDLYGNSDLRAAYRSWFSKDIIIRFWNIYLERFGMPTAVGRYDTAISPAQKDDLKTILKNIQAKTSITLPKSIEVELLEARRQGNAGYMEAIQQHNKMIARAVLVPDLLGYSETKGGSYALGEKQFDVFLWILEKLRRDLERNVIFTQITRRLIDLNFPDKQNYPMFKFTPLTQENKQELFKIWLEAVKDGAVTPTSEDEEFLRRGLNFPEKQPAQKNQVEARKYTARKPNIYEKKVNFTEIKNTLDEQEHKMMIKAGSIIQKAGQDLIDRIFKQKIIENKDLRAIEDLTLRYMNEFRVLWRDELPKIFKIGERHAKAEVLGKHYQTQTTVGNLEPKKALEYFERQSFRITGTEKERILRGVKDILYTGLKTGKTNAQVRFELEEFFAQYTVIQKVRVGNRTTTAAVDTIPGRLSTIVRTNYTDAYNQGRLAGFQDPDVKDLVAAYEYSAVLDDRTTPYCQTMDGKIFKANDSEWSHRVPPAHFNCRSLLVPILNDEDFKISNWPAIKPAKGFG